MTPLSSYEVPEAPSAPLQNTPPSAVNVTALQTFGNSDVQASSVARNDASESSRIVRHIESSLGPHRYSSVDSAASPVLIQSLDRQHKAMAQM